MTLKHLKNHQKKLLTFAFPWTLFERKIFNLEHTKSERADVWKSDEKLPYCLKWLTKSYYTTHQSINHVIQIFTVLFYCLIFGLDWKFLFLMFLFFFCEMWPQGTWEEVYLANYNLIRFIRPINVFIFSFILKMILKFLVELGIETVIDLLVDFWFWN